MWRNYNSQWDDAIVTACSHGWSYVSVAKSLCDSGNQYCVILKRGATYLTFWTDGTVRVDVLRK